jgi:para-aminobenzoate synthetase/4-amino-4-deoxychorismate lyase
MQNQRVAVKALPLAQPYFLTLDAMWVGGRRALTFLNPLTAIRADSPEEVLPTLDGIEAALDTGCYVAGYFSYELGHLLESKLTPALPEKRDAPLLWAGVFGRPEQDESDKAPGHTTGRAYAGPLRHEWDEQAYRDRFDKIRELIAAGDVYQVNLTFRSEFVFAGSPFALYRQLRAQAGAPYSGFIDDGNRQILSLSPELFFSKSAVGEMVARPMKGTAPRSKNIATDERAKILLQTSTKERAENLMIVDLMRNDLGRICELGSVHVPELFTVETYPTVHQMVSTVRGNLRQSTPPRDILKALFPCGSVTGTPKIRAMEIIRELEQSSRGVYCGAIGYFAPDGSAQFNVAIRTITIYGNRGSLGVGGAIVQDSRAESEYAECLLKARYFTEARKPIELIETLRWCPEDGLIRLELHLARLEQSAETFGITFARNAAVDLLRNVARGIHPLQVRLTLSESGDLNVSTSVLEEQPAHWRFSLSQHRTFSGDFLLQHKTSWRELYEEEHAKAKSAGCNEAVFLNERGEISEGSRTNIFMVAESGEMITPPLSSGLLNGCLRQELIAEGRCQERVLYPADLVRAKEIYLGNSLRGLVPASLAAG